MIRNSGAEYGSAECWSGLEKIRRGEPGLRRNVGRSGDYAFCWRGQSRGIRSDWIAVDPSKTYELSGYFKAKSGVFTGVTFGVIMADAQQRVMQHVNVFSLKGTRTELAAPCRAGERILLLKDASGWKPGTRFMAAFGVGENELTFNVTPRGINEVSPAGDHWRMVLSNPCRLDLPAGTPVVENRSGNNGIYLYGFTEIQGEWTELKGTIGPQQWWPGTAYARVVVIGPGLRIQRRGADAKTLLMDDFALRMLK